LPVDDFLEAMIGRKNAPRIIFSPKRLSSELWTESVTAFVYAGIEQAFVAAGRVPGANASGYADELRELKVWCCQTNSNQSQLGQ
jgi:hypothetical protein